MKRSPIPAALLALVFVCLPGCNTQTVEQEPETHEITVTTPELRSVTLTMPFVCQIHSQRHIDVSALERGYLKAVHIKEGQRVTAAEVMFQEIPILYQKQADAENAAASYAQLQYQNTEQLTKEDVVSKNELLLNEAKLAKEQAKAQLATAELNFATIKAPFDGIVDRLHQQQGSLVEKGTILTTLSDNRVMWVYFNVPETIYLNQLADAHRDKELQVNLRLADGSIFNHAGKISTIEADFNNQTGNIPFRADFPNPEGLLRNGQTGTVLVHRELKNALVIPQRATFEIFDKRYVYVVDKDHVAHKHEIAVKHELDDLFVIKKGLAVDDRIILEGVRQVHDGDKINYVFRPAKQVDEHLKYHAE